MNRWITLGFGRCLICSLLLFIFDISIQTQITVGRENFSSGLFLPASGVSVSVGSQNSRPTYFPLFALNQNRRRPESLSSSSGSASYYRSTFSESGPNSIQNRLEAFLSNKKIPNCKELKLLWIAGQLFNSRTEESEKLLDLLRSLLNLETTLISEKTALTNVGKSLEPLVYISERLPEVRETSLPVLNEKDLFEPKFESDKVQNSENSNSDFRRNNSEYFGDNYGRVVILDRNTDAKSHFGAFLDNRLHIEPDITVRDAKKKPQTSAGIVGRRMGDRVGRLHSAFRSDVSIPSHQGNQNRRGRDEIALSGFWHSKLSKPTVNLISDSISRIP